MVVHIVPEYLHDFGRNAAFGHEHIGDAAHGAAFHCNRFIVFRVNMDDRHFDFLFINATAQFWFS